MYNCAYPDGHCHLLEGSEDNILSRGTLSGLLLFDGTMYARVWRSSNNSMAHPRIGKLEHV